MAQVAEAFPQQRLLIVARRQNDVRRIAAHLENCGVDAGQFIPHFAQQGHERVVVTTYWGLSAETCAQFRDIAIYVNPAESMGWLGTSGFGRLHRARVFGLIPYGLQPPSPVREFVAAVFGEDSVSVPRHGWIARNVQVAFVPARVADVMVEGEDDLAVRRHAVWHHPVRNRRIADLAKMLATGSCAKLKKGIPGLAKLVFDSEGGRIGVLVASVEHGLALRRYLDWPLLTQDGALTDGLSKCDTGRLNSADSDPSLVYCNVIVTTAAMPQAGVFDVLIRADAGVDLPAIYDHHVLGHPRVDDDLLMIDLDDRHHPLVRKWTRGRKAAYLATDWNLIGGPAADAHDRIHVPGRIRQPVLVYQQPHPRRLVEGEDRTAEYNYQRRRERRRQQLRKQDWRADHLEPDRRQGSPDGLLPQAGAGGRPSSRHRRHFAPGHQPEGFWSDRREALGSPHGKNSGGPNGPASSPSPSPAPVRSGS